MAMIPMNITHKYNRDQFHGYLDSYFGSKASDKNRPADWGDKDDFEIPEHVYRSMSTEEYEGGLKRGYLKSDERNNSRPEDYIDDGVPTGNDDTGTWAGKWVAESYLPREGGVIAKIGTGGSSKWDYHETHKDDELFTLDKIDMSDVQKVTPPVRVSYKDGKATYIVKEQR